MGRKSRDKRDIYYRLAKEEGFRARSAYKLLQLDATLGLFRAPMRVVDLCAAPGGWSQVVARTGCACVAVDLKEMAPIPGVFRVVGDLTARDTVERIKAMGGADVVLCDGAPDVYGLGDIDAALQHRLVEVAVEVARDLLVPGGAFVSKVYRGPRSDRIFRDLRRRFSDVVCAKPKCSRNASLEAYAVARGFGSQDARGGRGVVPFVACGFEDFDADSSYPLRLFPDREYAYRDPVQMPINPTHLAATTSHRRHIPDEVEPLEETAARPSPPPPPRRPPASSSAVAPAHDAASLAAALGPKNSDGVVFDDAAGAPRVAEE
ncbi:hypothetical protein CTAYLR_006591 [Chrysophaeum taylorii]|uniref:Ribosomal RNA methyltransferase FtsJ domain-containing protein n=1 Tax=Chrysophaeum taylorii TaxID=2483200 RepID=A0AAD7XTP8_9STRA|nr:hypothetical protein CTAYLR_006591 [Chrysophaeum taylorii]